MSFFWPGSLAGRVALLLALSLLVIQVISVPYYLNEQARTATEVFEQSTSARIVHITRLFDTLSSEQRRKLLPSLTGPSLSVELFYDPPRGIGAPFNEEQMPVSELAEQLRRPIELRKLAGNEGDVTLLSGLFASRELIAIWVPLADEVWVRFVTASSLPSLGWIAHLAAQIFLVSVGVIAFAVWAARQMTRPIRTFSAAAQRLGRDVNAPPIDEQGSHELRRATRAFNRMQNSLQRYVEDRTHMLAAISHDLRTSLTRLQLRTAYIADAEQQRKAERDIEDMDSMLSATLAFSRDDAGSEAQAKVDLAEMLQSLCDDIGDGGSPVDYRGPENLSYACRPVSLQRALANLLVNASSYGDRAQVKLIPGEAELLIEILDRGPGISASDLEQVFEPFVRLDSARSRSTGGTGLGLPIARSVIHAHGGTMTLRNRKKGGLRVSVRLPR